MRTLRTGHTLIELVVVVAIIAVVASIAITSYDSYIRKSKQDNLKAQILSAATAQERHFTARGRYTAVMNELVPFGLKGELGTNGLWKTETTTLYTGIFIDNRTGLAYWIAGNADIDKTAETIEDCWLYLSRNAAQNGLPAKNGFVYLHDDRDADNVHKATVPNITNSVVCKP